MLTTLEEKLDPRWAALLIIDMQNDYLDERGVLGQEGRDLEPGRAIVEPIRQVIAAARGVEIPVVFLRNWHSSASDSEVWLEASNRRHPGGPRSAEANTWGAEWYPTLEPQDGDVKIDKTRYDAFLKTRLDQELRSRNVKTVVVCGTTTNVCVESTVRSAHMRDYYVVVVSDCCAAPDINLHRTSLTNIDRHFGSLVTLSDVLSIWSATERELATSDAKSKPFMV
jgi:ureidoacrylate peracid hydrolase